MHANFQHYLFLFFVTLALAVPWAAADTQDGTLSGIVIDATGIPLPGVTITVAGPALQGERLAITDTAGRWRLPLVPVGPGYEVSASLDGFQAVIQTEIRVNIGANTRVDFTLVEGSGDLGEITVTAEAPLIDAKKSSISETITYEFMEDIPTGRTYFDAMSMAAGVARSGNVNAHGADDSDNVFLVDGVDTTDNATGTFGLNFSYEAIQEVEMKTGGFEAEYGRATGAIANVVTKSGGNEFHGAIPVYYTNLDMKRHQEADRGAVDEEDFYELEPGGSLGGPIMRDRLWFFASYNNFTRRIEGTNEFDEAISRSEVFEEYMAKLTWQVDPDNKLVGQVSSDPATIDSRDSLDPDIMASAYSQQEQGGLLYKLQWTSIFTPNLFLETRVAAHEVNLTIGPANADPMDDVIVDDRDGAGRIYYGNSGSSTDINRPRRQYSTVLNSYRGDWAGEHNFKFGVEYQDFEFTEDAIFPNTYTINRVNNQTGAELPDQWLHQTNLSTTNSGDILTIFAQDAWTWRDNWSINVGLRYERQTQDNDVGETVYEFDSLIAPRLGVSWDINGDGRSKVYANYGRYYDAVGTYLGQFTNRQTNVTTRYEGTYDPANPTNPDNWEVISVTGGDVNTNVADPNLDPNFKDEITAGYEFEFATDFSAGAKLIYNWQNNLIEDVIGNEDAVRAGDTNDVWYYVTNVQRARRNYKGLELQLKKRLSNNYQFLLVYTLSEARGSVANGNQSEGTTEAFDMYEAGVNRYGYLPWDDRHYLKLNGSYHLPWGVIAGVGIGWRSGRPYTRIGQVGDYLLPGTNTNAFNGWDYYVTERGSERLGNVWWIDLRVTKDFNIGDTELSVIVDAFNVTNNQYILSRREDDNDAFGTSNAWQQAGNFVVGLKYSF